VRPRGGKGKEGKREKGKKGKREKGKKGKREKGKKGKRGKREKGSSTDRIRETLPRAPFSKRCPPNARKRVPPGGG
jgi:hypothetical protein